MALSILDMRKKKDQDNGIPSSDGDSVLKMCCDLAEFFSPLGFCPGGDVFGGFLHV